MEKVDWSKFELSCDVSGIPELVGREFRLKGYGSVKPDKGLNLSDFRLRTRAARVYWSKKSRDK